MSQPYRHLNLGERRTIYRLLNAKLSVDAVAAALGRHRSTVYREIRRNEFREVKEYRGNYPVTADDRARRRRQRHRKLLRDARERLLETLAEMEAMVEATLAFARGEASSESSREIDLAAFVKGLVEDLRELGHDVTLAAPDRARTRSPAAHGSG